MKSWLLFLPLPLLFVSTYSCRKESAQPMIAELNVNLASDTTQVLDFDEHIVPILKSHCSPCHFPGGKMYTKMPFDQSKTIRDHSAGVTKRFKDPELEKLKAYLQQEVQ